MPTIQKPVAFGLHLNLGTNMWCTFCIQWHAATVSKEEEIIVSKPERLGKNCQRTDVRSKTDNERLSNCFTTWHCRFITMDIMAQFVCPLPCAKGWICSSHFQTLGFSQKKNVGCFSLRPGIPFQACELFRHPCYPEGARVSHVRPPMFIDIIQFHREEPGKHSEDFVKNVGGVQLRENRDQGNDRTYYTGGSFSSQGMLERRQISKYHPSGLFSHTSHSTFLVRDSYIVEM